jgi:hypothetical protein
MNELSLSREPTAKPSRRFKVLQRITSAHGDPEAERGAKERFRKGIVHAQHVRDLPLTLVP